MTVTLTLQRWDDDVGLCIPRSMLEQLGLDEGSVVRLTVTGNRLVIHHPALPTLADLLAQCKPENRPDPVDWGPRVGREII